ncbi:hypothetical protein [Allostreptomyces psammosilenae]|uniref:Uncharacterized protein n=1 Tax=Allostreptomyces psammosilenae TaxID=1892865 RepID=A0A852ZNW9_9ACTN|nr:hypothetical protein [Allostreptomyces psammosilenae]NYI04079.1 hypothetical protein [Allostreptomyces psammosilenae]
MDRLTEIAFLLPESPESHAFLSELSALLAEVAYADHTRSAGTAGGPGDRLTLTPPRPVGARPVTAFQLADVPAPVIALDTGRSIAVHGGGDGGGQPAPAGGVEMADLTRRLAGHVRGIDHTGVNVPARTTSPEQWHDLVGALASASTMYRYPTGEDWPFVLPSTSDELLGGIRDFVAGREPRFELVHDEWLTGTQWQFALWTDLTRAELEALFPEPEGGTLPGLEEIFRVVPVRHPWPGLGIRFDLCYRIDDGPSDWETGEWLVTEGGRIR